ncbi:hypothetical protein Tco_0727293 [Tanacetum coccineum]|uniref:Uncharacterized protein n=1 Tax=Tanacetum coccineum TaxID=301880 RepID=A0ABQ4YKH5_9ASTR
MFYLVASRSTSGKHVQWINSFTSTITDACLDHQQLSQRLHVYGLYEVRISGDGNCQVNKARVTPSDIQHSAAYSDLRVLQIGIRAKVIENQLGNMSLRHLAVHTLSVYTTLSPGRAFWGADEEEIHEGVEAGTVDYPYGGEMMEMMMMAIHLDDGDDDDGDSSGDDADGEDEDDEEEEEEENLAPADSAIVVPTDEPVFPPEGT